MPINWNATAYADHYAGRIRWADATDPIPNDAGQRMGVTFAYDSDFARYAARGPTPYWYYMQIVKKIVDALTSLGLANSSRIIIVGCGLGYLIYCFRKASFYPDLLVSYPNIYGIDDSAYIATKWDSERLGDEDYVNADWTLNNTSPVQTALSGMTGGFYDFDFVINHVTESYDPVVDSVELAAMFAACETGLVGIDFRRIIHIVDNALQPGETGNEEYYQTLRDYNTNLMTLSDWSLEKPTHSWIDARTGFYILGSV